VNSETFEADEDYQIKIDNGKAEYIDSVYGYHEIFDIRYSEMLDYYEMYEYRYDGSKWNEITFRDYNPQTLRNYLNMSGLTRLPESFSSLTYEKKSHKYTYMRDDRPVDIFFNNGKLALLTYQIEDNDVIYNYSWEVTNYGKTSVKIPKH